MAQFASDTFTGGASNDPVSGVTWTKHGSYSGAAVLTGAGRARGDGTLFTLYYANGTPATAEYDVQADFIATATVTASDLLGVAGRINTAADTFYRVEHAPGGTFASLELFKKVAGVSTSLGSVGFGVDWNASATVIQKLQIRDATKKVFIGGVEKLSSTDNAITAAGKAGFYWKYATAPGNTTGEHIDNFTADDAAAAAAGALPFVSASRRACRGLYLR